MNIELRDPNIIMKLSRLGSFHQSRLSFLRSFLSEFKDWQYNRDLFDLDQEGYGTAVYSFKKKDRVYSLVCFANEISDDEIEIGMGIHGEPGIKREKLKPANDLVDDLYKRIIEDSRLKSNDNVAIMINSLGATPLEELYIISKRVNENLTNSKINNTKTYVGRYATSMEMAGMSITTLKLNDNLKKYLLANSECPFWNN